MSTEDWPREPDGSPSPGGPGEWARYFSSPTEDKEEWQVAVWEPFPEVRMRVTSKGNGKYCLEAWRVHNPGGQTTIDEYLGPVEFGGPTSWWENLA